MKKLLSAFALLAMLFLASCGQADEVPQENEALDINTESVDIDLDAIIE